MLPMLIPIIGGILGKVIDRAIPDPEAASKAKLDAMSMVQTESASELAAAAQVITAEAQSESYLAANWRPITMLCFVAVIVNNYILMPYAGVLGIPIVPIDLPVDVWDIIQVGLGGYVMGRSAEKLMKTWKSTGTETPSVINWAAERLTGKKS